MPAFKSRNPSEPDFWTERFEQNFMPWDKGGVPANFRQFVADTPKLVTLIPGCGHAYEVVCLADAGWQVTAIDFSPAAVVAARKVAGRWESRIQLADFFTFTPAVPIELIYERAFLCALPRRMWSAVAARWAELLAPGGLLAGCFFFDDEPKGPPFGIAAKELEALLTTNFERLQDNPVTDSIPAFADRERWQVWRRKRQFSASEPQQVDADYSGSIRNQLG
jgi:SAM-dependent methyltransferase